MNVSELSRPTRQLSGPSLRLAEPRDFLALQALSRSPGVFSESEVDSLLDDLHSCDSAAGDRIALCHLGETETLGFIQYSPAPITHGSWYVYWIAVRGDTHGQGIGAALLAYAEADVLALGGRQILIETSASPQFEKARRFYLNHGYGLVARVPDYYSAGDDKCIFRKVLG